MALSPTTDDSFNSLLPETAETEDTSISTDDNTIQPDMTYKLDLEGKCISGNITGKESVIQGLFKRLLTDSEVYEIYSDNYGLQVNDLVGQPRAIVKSELQRRITKSAMDDDRVISVTDFNFSQEEAVLTVIFTVNTVYGTFALERGYEI